MLKAPDESIKDETADRVNSLSVVPVSVATYSKERCSKRGYPLVGNQGLVPDQGVAPLVFSQLSSGSALCHIRNRIHRVMSRTPRF